MHNQQLHLCLLGISSCCGSRNKRLSLMSFSLASSAYSETLLITCHDCPPAPVLSLYLLVCRCIAKAVGGEQQASQGDPKGHGAEYSSPTSPTQGAGSLFWCLIQEDHAQTDLLAALCSLSFTSQVCYCAAAGSSHPAGLSLGVGAFGSRAMPQLSELAGLQQGGCTQLSTWMGTLPCAARGAQALNWSYLQDGHIFTLCK